MASPRSGLGTQFGYSVAETTYGTPVTVTRFRRIKSNTVKPVIGIAQGSTIQGGLRSPIGAHRKQTTIGAEGSVEFEATYTDMGLLLQAIFGKTSSSAVAVTGSAYTQTHTLTNEDYGLSHTLQTSRVARSAAGTAVPATVSGAKITAATFNCEVSGFLEIGLTYDGRQYDNTTALATASYPVATAPVRGVEMCVKTGTFGAETSLTGVRSWSMSYTRPMDTADYTSCASGLKNEPVQNGVLEITGTLNRDWVDTALENLALANTPTSLVVEWTGSLITGSTYAKHKLSLPGTFIEPDAQDVSGPEELLKDWSWSWAYDGTNAPKWVTTTTDSAL